MLAGHLQGMVETSGCNGHLPGLDRSHLVFRELVKPSTAHGVLPASLPTSRPRMAQPGGLARESGEAANGRDVAAMPGEMTAGNRPSPTGRSDGGVEQTSAETHSMFAYVGSFTTAQRKARGDGIHVYRADPATGVLRSEE